MSQPNMTRVKGDGIEIQLAQWDGEGSPVLCVHGLTANCRCFDLLAEGLTPAHHVIAMDIRGRGLSDKPDTGYSLESHAGDVVAVIEDLGLSSVTLIGHSLGAYISLSTAARRPDLVDRLVLLDGGAPLNQDQWTKVAEAIKPSLERLKQTFQSFEAYIETQKKIPALQPWNQTIEEYFRYEAQEIDGEIRSRINPAHIEEESSNIIQSDTNQYYPRIHCPVLILRATKGILSDEDLVLPEPALAALVEALPQAQVVNLEDTNHYSMIFQPNKRRDQAILDFLS
jgi:pimeloyl-ACP methyl ester carboxylesterase